MLSTFFAVNERAEVAISICPGSPDMRRLFVGLVILLLAGVFVACESAVGPQEPDATPQFAKSSNAPVARSSNAPVAQVSVGADTDISEFWPGFPNEFWTFNASVDANGNGTLVYRGEGNVAETGLNMVMIFAKVTPGMHAGPEDFSKLMVECNGPLMGLPGSEMMAGAIKVFPR